MFTNLQLVSALDVEQTQVYITCMNYIVNSSDELLYQLHYNVFQLQCFVEASGALAN